MAGFKYLVSHRNEHCFANILRFSRPCSTRYDLHFSNIFLCSASPLSHSRWSHLTLALTMISSFVFLFILSSQPHLSYSKPGKNFLVLQCSWNGNQKARKRFSRSAAYCTSGVLCTHSRHLVGLGLFLMRFCNVLEQLFCCSNGMLTCQAFLIVGS